MSTATSEPLVLAGLAWPVELRTHPRARRLRLVLDEHRGLLRLTVPRRVSRSAALDWARRQSNWVEAQLARIEPAEPLVAGATIPFDGGEVLLFWDEAAPRTPRLVDAVLACGGPPERFGDRVARWLRDEARRRLVEETRSLTAISGIGDAPVSVGDAGTRWGSCSASGAIRYNWRLILAPPAVRAYVVAHEVAHRVHMNHGAGFHALQAELYDGDVGEARLTLRRIGPRLKRVGRG
ncbi:MAG: M48 family metallopeptidase [Sphingomonas bacterium]|nr:M48 family metallopeptidase [Sphingomonas bacterium]